ncbi:MAG: N-acetylmuramic acid 6-phosphate etherase [Paracoccaceae bacterium]
MSDRPTEARHPSSAGLHAAAGAEVLARLFDAQQAAVRTVGAAIPAIEAAAGAAVDSLGAGGRLIFAGAGSSGLMALADCLELSGTFGLSPARTPMLFAGGTAALLHMTGSVEDDTDAARAEIAALKPGGTDLVICVSASGTTPYTLAVAEAAARSGATVVGLANVAGSALLARADIGILLETGPEVINGSTRLGAATAQKVALNMLSVLVGIGLGHVHDGYMVNVIADNAKLRDRAARIVAALSARPIETARAALDTAGGSVKAAVLVARGLSAERAAQELERTAGHLAPHLDE